MSHPSPRLRESPHYPRWVLLTCLAGLFATTFTITILAVSIQAIASDLRSTPDLVAWVITAPMLAQALALPTLGKLGDLYGHRRVYLLGSAAAMLATLVTAMAWSAGSLIAFRTLAQLAGTATMPASMALLFHVYAPERRVKALGWVNLVTAGAPVLGLAIGGVMVDTLGWRPLFLIQSLLSAIALTAAHFVLGESETQPGLRVDLAGAAALAVAAFALTFGINRLPTWGVGHPAVVVALLCVPLALWRFLAVERRVAHPLIPLEFFGRRNFAAPMAAGFFLNFSYMGGFIISPLLLQSVFLFSTTATSFLTMLRPVSLSLSSPLGSSLATAIGERTMAILGSTAVTLAMLAFAVGAATGSVLGVGIGLVLAGVGLGGAAPSMQAVVANAVDEKSFGIASSSMQMASSIGAVAGISSLTALCADAVTPGPFLDGYLLGAAGAMLGVGSALFIARRPKQRGLQ